MMNNAHKFLNNLESNTPQYRVYETLREGVNKKVQVTQLQRSLPLWTSTQILNADGSFGQKTKDAVTNFQKGVDLSPDGVVGAMTGKALGIWSDVEKGFDISHWNTIQWGDVTPDFKFVNMKATQGKGFVDPQFTTNVEQAFLLGLDVGVYHFTDYTNSPFVEAENFINTTSPFSHKFSQVYLDLEFRGTSLKSQQILEWVHTFFQIVKSFYPLKTLGLYTSKNYLAEMGLTSYECLAQYTLWAANWQRQPLVFPWKRWSTWQYSNLGNVEFCVDNLDLNLRAVPLI